MAYSQLIPHPTHTTDLFVVRHGQTDWNVQGRMQGSLPIPLNDLGQAQVRQAGEALKSLNPAAVLSSPVFRTLETARLICEVANIDPNLIQSLDAVGEFDMGDWNEKTFTELRQLDAWQTYVTSPETAGFPGGETMVEIWERVVLGVNEVVKAGSGGRLLVTTHAGIARILTLAAMGATLSSYHRISSANAGITHIRLSPGYPARLYTANWRPDPVPMGFTW